MGSETPESFPGQRTICLEFSRSSVVGSSCVTLNSENPLKTVSVGDNIQAKWSMNSGEVMGHDAGLQWSSHFYG